MRRRSLLFFLIKYDTNSRLKKKEKRSEYSQPSTQGRANCRVSGWGPEERRVKSEILKGLDEERNSKIEGVEGERKERERGGLEELKGKRERRISTKPL